MSKIWLPALSAKFTPARCFVDACAREARHQNPALKSSSEGLGFRVLGFGV